VQLGADFVRLVKSKPHQMQKVFGCGRPGHLGAAKLWATVE
jgi:hypothetical protein